MHHGFFMPIDPLQVINILVLPLLVVHLRGAHRLIGAAAHRVPLAAK